MNAKLQTIKAETSKTGPRGRIWSAGLHQVYVDDKPATVHVPQYTVLDTFNQLTQKLKVDGSVRFGVDHLPPSLYEDNQILAKMNLEDVGTIDKVVYDGESIYIQDSKLTNKEIQRLHNEGELPAYSIVGVMEASPCPSERADYVVDNIVIDRVDFVEEGGCQVCTTSAEPGEILITSKKAKIEADKMTEAKEEQVSEVVEGESVDESASNSTEEIVEDESVVEESTENSEKVDTEPAKEKDEETVATEEPEQATEETKELEDDKVSNDVVARLEKEIQELKKLVDGKKPRLSAKASEDKTEKMVEHLIQAGKATPNMKQSLTQLAMADPESFKEYSNQLEKVVDYSMKSKLAPVQKKPKTESEDDDLTVEEAWKRLGRS